MKLIQYEDIYRQQTIDLILNIQNSEAKINLSLKKQPDLKNISESYIKSGGNFWLMIEKGHVLGTIGLMMKEKNTAVLKKFFVEAEHRGQKIGLQLYEQLLKFAKQNKVKYIILDTPSVAVRSHEFYAKAGFRQVAKDELPIEYSYPDRDSLLFMKEI